MGVTVSKELLSVGSFQRIEDKFLLPKEQESNFVNKVSQFMEPAYLDKSTDFTLVGSIYFDSNHLDMFHHHFEKLVSRSKLRIRRYAPNGTWSQGHAFLEAKSKVDDVSLKKRFKVNQNIIDNLMAGNNIELNAELYKLNKKIDASELDERVLFVNGILATYKATPQVNVEYQRLAFEGDDGLRVTMDKNVNISTFTPLDPIVAKHIKHEEAIWSNAENMKTKFSNDSSIIVEVKHTSPIPNWLEEYMASINVTKTSFSKYCWSMANLIDEAGLASEDSI